MKKAQYPDCDDVVGIMKTKNGLSCNCGSQVFSIEYVMFEDYEEGVIAQCQECENVLVVTKD